MRPHLIPILCLVLVGLTQAAGADTEASLRVELTTERQFYTEGVDSEIFVAARIIPPAASTSATTNHRNLALVLDTSGSMAGDAMQALRTSADGVLDQLRVAETISVITFGSEVTTVIPASRLDQARAQRDRLARLEPAGGAALYDAITQAAAQVRRFVSPTTSNEVVVLIDGPPTRGPREPDDFVRLAEALSQEGIRLTTIGLGHDFDEDLLAAMARAGNGRFLYAPSPADLESTLINAVRLERAAPVARDLTLRLQFKNYCRDFTAHGRHPATIDGDSLVFQLPDVSPGQPVTLLASAQIWNTYAASGHQRDAVIATLDWQPFDADATTSRRETQTSLPLRFSADPRVVRESVHEETFRLAVDALITDGLQEAITRIDDGDFVRAQQILQRTRNKVRNLADVREDEQIANRLTHLDTYLDDVAARGLNQLDRKILRTGLSNQFTPPPAEDAADRN